MKVYLKSLALLVSIILIPTICYGAAMTLAVTPAGAGNKSGENGSGVADWSNAMGEAEFEIDLEGNAEAGDIYYLAGGTYTLDSDYNTAKVGTPTAPIRIIGVKAGTTAEPPTSSDWAYTTDRPVIACAAWTFILEDRFVVRNLIFTTTATTGVECDAANHIINCKVTNSGVATRYGIKTTGPVNKIIDCEVISTNGYGTYSYPGTGNMIVGCYIHDSSFGILLYTTYSSVINSIIETCTNSAIHSGTTASVHFIIGNTIYNCASGISYGGASHPNDNLVINNIISTCTDGFKSNYSGSISYSNLFDYNNWYNNTHDMSWDNGTSEDNSAKGIHAIDADPDFVDANGRDFTVNAGSPVLDAGLQPSTNMGLTGDYKWNIGADQDDNTAAGGGGGGASFFTGI